MENSLLNSRFGDFVEDDTLGVFVLQIQNLLEVPCDGFSLAVLIGCEPDGVRLLRFLAELVNQMFFVRIDGIMRFVAVLEINTKGVLRSMSRT